MPTLRLQHAFQGMTGLAEDRYVNTFHFVGIAVPDNTLCAALADLVKSFYHLSDGVGTDVVHNYMSRNLDTLPQEIKIYNLADAQPRPAIYQEFYDLGSFGSGRSLPDEVAVCLSYEAAPSAGQPQARRRGRIYIGPLNDSCMQPATDNTQSRPNTSLRSILISKAAQLSGSSAALGYEWAVYSPTSGQTLTLSRVWSDDAWDTQRRRGLKPSSQLSQGV